MTDMRWQKGRPPRIPNLREQVTKMLENGASLKEIAADLGFSYGYIRNRRHQWGLSDKKVVASNEPASENS